MRITTCFVLLLGLAAPTPAQTTQPTTRPATASPDDMLRQLIAPARPALQPLQPAPDPPDKNKAATSVAPGATGLTLRREGDFIVDRVARLNTTADGQKELVFEADGRFMQDPPMIVLPSLNLMVLEGAIKKASRDLRFRISGQVTEYNGRNYILVSKVVVEPG